MYRSVESSPAIEVVLRASALRRGLAIAATCACALLLAFAVVALSTKRTLVCARTTRGGPVACIVERTRPGMSPERRDLGELMDCTRAAPSERGWERGRFDIETRAAGSPHVRFVATGETCTSSLVAFATTPLPNGFLASAAPGERAVAIGADKIWQLVCLGSGFFALLFAARAIFDHVRRVRVRIEGAPPRLRVVGGARAGTYPVTRTSHFLVNELVTMRVNGVPVKGRELWLVGDDGRHLLAENLPLGKRDVERALRPLEARIDELRQSLPRAAVAADPAVVPFPRGALRLAPRFVASRAVGIALATAIALVSAAAGVAAAAEAAAGSDANALGGAVFAALLALFSSSGAIVLGVRLRHAYRAARRPTLLRMNVEDVVEHVSGKRTGMFTYTLALDQPPLRMRIGYPKGERPFFAEAQQRAVIAVLAEGNRPRPLTVIVPRSDLYPFTVVNTEA